jgi:hypothetical protein
VHGIWTEKEFRAVNTLSKKEERLGWWSAQVVECLPSKCEALSSNPSTARIINKKRERSQINNLTHNLKKLEKKIKANSEQVKAMK